MWLLSLRFYSSPQAVVVPVGITGATPEEERQKIYTASAAVTAALKRGGIRSHFDDRHQYTAGWKFAHWELKGVPLRIEVGPRDIAARTVTAVRRVDGKKLSIPVGDFDFSKVAEPTVPKYPAVPRCMRGADAIEAPAECVSSKFVAVAQAIVDSDFSRAVHAALDDVHVTMYNAAKIARDGYLTKVAKWEDFVTALSKSNIIMAPHCADEACEVAVKAESAVQTSEADAEEDERAPSMGAKALCVPFGNDGKAPDGARCFRCGKEAQNTTLWGRSY